MKIAMFKHNITKQPTTNSVHGYPNIHIDFLKNRIEHTCTRSRILLYTRLDQVKGSVTPASWIFNGGFYVHTRTDQKAWGLGCSIFFPVHGTIQSHLRPSRALATFEWPLWVIRASLKRAPPLTQSSGLVGHRWCFWRWLQTNQAAYILSWVSASRGRSLLPFCKIFIIITILPRMN